MKATELVKYDLDNKNKNYRFYIKIKKDINIQYLTDEILGWNVKKEHGGGFNFEVKYIEYYRDIMDNFMQCDIKSNDFYYVYVNYRYGGNSFETAQFIDKCKNLKLIGFNSSIYNVRPGGKKEYINIKCKTAFYELKVN